ncbi:MAG: DUF1292 domain-containing protein [Lachnospiraceae bacterium]|nr:DUF1292 domain-containing protein [Lachnospiraceae bacterium]
MAKSKKTNEDEDMTVDIELEDGRTINCNIITILTVEGRDYIALYPNNYTSEDGEEEVWFYRYSENEKDPNEEPVLDYIEDDEEYEKVIDAYDEFLDNCEFDMMDD